MPNLNLNNNKNHELTQTEVNERFLAACSAGDLEHIEYLLTSDELEFQADIDYEHSQGIVNAGFAGKTEVIKYLITSKKLKKHADIKTRGYATLCGACHNGHLNTVRYLLTSSQFRDEVDINAKDGLALAWACKEGRLEMAKYLLESNELKQKADVKNVVGLGSFWVCQRGHLQVLKYLCGFPDFLNSFMQESFLGSFRAACRNEHFHIASYLIFELNIPKTIKIVAFLYNNPELSHISEMFEIRQSKKMVDLAFSQKQDTAAEGVKKLSQFKL